VNQQELEALLAQIAPNNDPRRLVFGEATETVEREVPGPYAGADPVKTKSPVRVLIWTDPGTGMVLKVHADPGGTYTKISQGIDPKAQGEPATTPAQVAKDEQGTEIGSEQVTDAQGKTVKRTTYRRADGSTYTREDSVQAAPEKPQVVPGTLNTTSPNVGTVVNGQVVWTPNPNYNNPSPQPISIPGNPRTIIWDDGPGKPTRTEKNPAYVKPSKIMPHPSDPTRMINVTEDDQGNPVILPVDDKTTIRPADLPVLQAKYGEVAQGLGNLAADLNRRYAAGEITAEERKRAFDAAHAQASTQVSEINSILDNSRQIWAGELQQRGQTLGETQSRRAYAGNIFGNAVSLGGSIAQSAGPGHGAAIARGVGSLLNIGQQYAGGMGGFRESPEVQLPRALQQAREVGLPGLPAPGGMPQAGAPPAGAVGPTGVGPTGVGATAPSAISAAAAPAAPAPSGGGFEPGSGISDTTDRGGAPREYTPASASTAAPAALSGPAPQGGLPPGINPLVAQLAQRLLGGMDYGGSPVAAGGGGVFDPMAEAERMTQGSDDPDWNAAVMKAAQGGQGQGYQRFFQ
jgi:hypothetical protein